MTLVAERADPGSTDDRAAVETLHESLSLQKMAFRRDPFPSLSQRREHLHALINMLMSHRQEVRDALAQDYKSHPALFADLIEILGPVGRAAIAIEQLPSWMAPEPRPVDPTIFGNARAEMRAEPKGVIGNITPWNFPFEIGCGALVEMLAAGNRVVLKPSDYTPACAELLARMISQTFDRDHVTVAVGGLELAREFSRLPWDHLMYTGNPGIARQVMTAAATNLVPVTLELGGKCPAVLTESGINERAIANILGTKMIKSGQLCVGVDYLLVPREHVDKVIALALSHARSFVPDHSRTEDCAGIISEGHFQRLRTMLGEARDAGLRVICLEDDAAGDPATRQMPITLVVDPQRDVRVATEEIFGPILPIVPYDSLDDAADYINDGSRPLAVYVFGDDLDQCEDLIRRTPSGGAAINACAIQGAIPTLGFGGSGASGMGLHHSIEGFREFSNLRAVAVRGDRDDLDLLYPPYSTKVSQFLDQAFQG